MNEYVFRKLADTLDTIPNGFPSTESGIELQMLAKMFTAEEAALAAEMRTSFEPAEEIAARADVETAEAKKKLKGMARRGLIYVRKGKGALLYALMPFVVGFYEEQLPILDKELAELAEQYFEEVRGKTILDAGPSIHRVVPVGEAVPFNLEVYPYERAVDIVESAKSWGVRECICRVQQKLVGKGCDHSLESCLVMAPIEGVFGGPGPTRAITKEQALNIVRMTEEEGLVHSTGNFQDGHHYI
jgi:hypothetical protein